MDPLSQELSLLKDMLLLLLGMSNFPWLTQGELANITSKSGLAKITIPLSLYLNLSQEGEFD